MRHESVWYSSHPLSIRSIDESGVFTCTAFVSPSQVAHACWTRLFDRAVCAEPLDQGAGFRDVPSFTELPDDGAFLRRAERHHYLNGAARIERCADSIRQAVAGHRGRRAERTVPADELGSVSGDPPVARMQIRRTPPVRRTHHGTCSWRPPPPSRARERSRHAARSAIGPLRAPTRRRG